MREKALKCLLSLNQWELEFATTLRGYPSLCRFGLESSGLLGSVGMVSPIEIASIVGGLFLIAL
jgi:hypothetical protein